MKTQEAYPFFRIQDVPLILYGLRSDPNDEFRNVARIRKMTSHFLYYKARELCQPLSNLFSSFPAIPSVPSISRLATQILSSTTNATHAAANAEFAIHSPALTPSIFPVNGRMTTQQTVANSLALIPSISKVNGSIATQQTVANSLASLTQSASASSIVFLVIPFFLGLIYSSSKEKKVQNINIKLSATSKEKTYTIGFGRDQGDRLSLSFAVKAGSLVHLPKNTAAKIEKFPPKIFDGQQQETHSECIITVDDPNNPLLKNGPIRTYIPLSEHEGFRLIQQDPTLIAPPLDTRASNNLAVAANTFTSLSTVSMQITEPISKLPKERTQNIVLPFDGGKHYLTITQH